MNSLELLIDLIWQAAKLRAGVEALQRSSALSKSAKDKLYGTHWSLESVGEELVRALAAEQLVEHLHGEAIDRQSVEA